MTEDPNRTQSSCWKWAGLLLVITSLCAEKALAALRPDGTGVLATFKEQPSQ